MSYILVTMQINVVVNLYRKYTLRGYFQSMTVNLFIYTLTVLLLVSGAFAMIWKQAYIWREVF